MTAVPEPDGATERIARYIRSARFGDLPDHVVDYTKRVILDTLGCMVLGSTMEPGQIIRYYAAAQGGSPDATVIGGRVRLPAALSALVNGTSGHADELDAVHRTHGHHAVVAVAAALAAAEAADATGRDLITAVALSFDVGTRLLSAVGGREALQAAHHTHTSAPFAIGAAAAASRLLELEVDQTRYALALAAYNIFSPMAFMDERNHMTKAMTHGQAAFAGVTGATLASFGFESSDRILEARDGLFEAWATSGSNPELLFDGLGENFAVTDTAFKVFSAGYPIQAPLAGALSLLGSREIELSAIDRVTVGMSSRNAAIVDERGMPSITLQDMLSVGMAFGRLGFDEAHDPASHSAPGVKELRGKIAIVRDPELDRDVDRRDVAWVEIEAAGTIFRTPAELPPGHWERGGLAWNELEAKFSTLCEPRLAAGAASGIISIVRDLDRIDSLDALATLLTPAS
jgi:2-methylcitrate dehydratase PrpD